MINWNKIQRRNPITNGLSWYPNLVLNGVATIDEIAEGIVEKCTLTKIDVKAVLVALEEVVIAQLKAGKSVRFGELGSFRPNLKTRFWDEERQMYVKGGCTVPTTIKDEDGKILAQGVTSDNIAGIGVTFSKSGEMSAKLSRSQLTFHMVKGEKAYPRA